MTLARALQLKAENDRLHGEALLGGKAGKAYALAYQERGHSLNRMIVRIRDREARAEQMVPGKSEQMVAGAKR